MTFQGKRAAGVENRVFQPRAMRKNVVLSHKRSAKEGK